MLLLTGTSASAKPPIKRFAEVEAEAELASPGGRVPSRRGKIFLPSKQRISRELLSFFLERPPRPRNFPTTRRKSQRFISGTYIYSFRHLTNTATDLADVRRSLPRPSTPRQFLGRCRFTRSPSNGISNGWKLDFAVGGEYYFALACDLPRFTTRYFLLLRARPCYYTNRHHCHRFTRPSTMYPPTRLLKSEQKRPILSRASVSRDVRDMVERSDDDDDDDDDDEERYVDGDRWRAVVVEQRSFGRAVDSSNSSLARKREKIYDKDGKMVRAVRGEG